MEQNQKNTSSTQENSSPSLTPTSNGTSKELEKSDIEDFLGFDSSQSPDAVAKEGIDLIFSVFDYPILTFQFIGTDASGKPRSPVYTFEDREKALRAALKHNKAGYDVYFMVNEGDGIPHPPKKTPRSQASVINFSSCFIDADGCELSRITEYLTKINLSPHLIVKTSESAADGDRYHIYFLITQEPKSDPVIRKWKAVQSMLHRLGIPSANPKTLKLDATMDDYSKILRVPGFVHVKKLFTSTIIFNAIETHQRYSLDTVFSLTNAQSFLDYNVTTYGSECPVHVPTIQDAHTIEHGQRFEAIRSYVMSLANKRYSRDEALQSFVLFVKKLPHPDTEFLDSSGLTAKSMALFDSAIGTVKVEDAITVESIRTSVDKNKLDLDDWYLPDEFYLSAPNGVGDVVKQAMALSRRPNAGLSFCVFTAGLSALKAMTHITPEGSSCSLYMLVVAPASSGKTEQLTLLQNTLSRNGYKTLVSNDIRSKEGIYNLVERNDGTGMLMLDEIGTILKAVQDKNANALHANMNRALLSLFSSGALDAYNCGPKSDTGKKKGEEEVIIKNPTLAICGFMVKETFEEVFDETSITSGLFQRFIPVFPKMGYVDLNPTRNIRGSIDSPLFKGVLPPPGEEDVAPLENAPPKEFIRMGITPEARERFKEFEDRYYRLKLEAEADPERSHLAGVYSRRAEQADRLATTLAKDVIDLPTMNYVIKFIESRHNASLKICEKSIGGGENKTVSKKEEKLLASIARICVEKNVASISREDLYRSARRPFRDMTDFDRVLLDLEKQKKIELIYFPDVKKSGNKTNTFIKLLDVL